MHDTRAVAVSDIDLLLGNLINNLGAGGSTLCALNSYTLNSIEIQNMCLMYLNMKITSVILF
jgi:hypothetical protein